MGVILVKLSKPVFNLARNSTYITVLFISDHQILTKAVTLLNYIGYNSDSPVDIVDDILNSAIYV